MTVAAGVKFICEQFRVTSALYARPNYAALSDCPLLNRQFYLLPISYPP